METTTRTLQVRLTAEEFVARAEALALERSRQRQLEADKKASAEDFKEQLEKSGAEIDRLSAIVAAHEEPRPVECEIRKDVVAGSVTQVRLDTGEVVWTRAMTEHERQGELFTGDGKPTEETPAPAEAAAPEPPLQESLAAAFLAQLQDAGLALTFDSVPRRFLDFCADRGVRGRERREQLWNEIKALYEERRQDAAEGDQPEPTA